MLSSTGTDGDIAEVLNGETYATDFTDAERALTIARTFADVEHVRWNAYMRTEGFHRFRYKDVDHKMHHNIVPVEELCFSDYVKDL